MNEWVELNKGTFKLELPSGQFFLVRWGREEGTWDASWNSNYACYQIMELKDFTSLEEAKCVIIERAILGKSRVSANKLKEDLALLEKLSTKA